MIVINGRRYFADIAIPELMTIFEFDGSESPARTKPTLPEPKREWIARDNDYAAGWKTYRARGRTTRTWARLRVGD